MKLEKKSINEAMTHYVGTRFIHPDWTKKETKLELELAFLQGVAHGLSRAENIVYGESNDEEERKEDAK